MTNDEIQMREASSWMTNHEALVRFAIRISSLIRHSSFDIRRFSGSIPDEFPL